MNKTKDTGYLFAKMSQVEDVTVDNEETPTRTFRHEEKSKKIKRDEEDAQSFRKWIADNIMLLVTLVGVFAGVVTGATPLNCVNETK